MCRTCLDRSSFASSSRSLLPLPLRIPETNIRLSTCSQPNASSAASFSGRSVPRALRGRRPVRGAAPCNATVAGEASRALQPIYTAADLEAVRAQGGGQVDHAVLAAGCFWTIEDVYLKVRGVLDVVSGYTGGHKESPTYQEVCTGDTGHVEAVLISFDPSTVSYRSLLDTLYSNFDLTTKDRQGVDKGPQYSSAVFALTEDQRKEALAWAAETDQKIRSRSPWSSLPLVGARLVTAIREFDGAFWTAEAVHQRYYADGSRRAAEAEDTWDHFLFSEGIDRLDV